MANTDLARIINSDEIQSVVNAPKQPKKGSVLKKNPLKNLGAMLKLNPYSKTIRRMELANAVRLPLCPMSMLALLPYVNVGIATDVGIAVDVGNTIGSAVNVGIATDVGVAVDVGTAVNVGIAANVCIAMLQHVCLCCNVLLPCASLRPVWLCCARVFVLQ